VSLGKLRAVSLLRYRAGRVARERLRAAGGLAGQVRVFVAPATGPKWLATYGVDQALIQGDGLRSPVPVLLAGASAGAWRSISLASPEPAKRHELMARIYSELSFSREDTPETVARKCRATLDELFAGNEAAILENGQFELAIHTARARGSGPRMPKSWYLASLTAASVLNPVAARAQHWALERIIFRSMGCDLLLGAAPGRRVPLTPDNLLAAAMASSTVPLSMSPLMAIPGAPAGSYLDGGLTDYHIASPYTHTDGVTLLLSHEPRILARWLDKFVPWRKPVPAVVEQLLHIHPTDAFVAQLVDGEIPSRHDFVRLADRPDERIRRWKEALARSELLGEELLRDLDTGRFCEKLEPLGDPEPSSGASG